MKRFIIEQSDEEFYTSTLGISLIGIALNRFTTLSSSIAKAVPLSHGISHMDDVSQVPVNEDYLYRDPEYTWDEYIQT